MNILSSLSRPRGQVDAPREPHFGGAVGNSGPSILEHYLRVARRWRWVIAGAILGSVLLGVVVTLLMTPQYTAVSTIEISREADQVTNIEGVERETSVADQEFYQTQYGLLRARSLAERVAAELGVIDRPEFLKCSDLMEPMIRHSKFPMADIVLKAAQSGNAKRLKFCSTRSALSPLGCLASSISASRVQTLNSLPRLRTRGQRISSR